MKTNYRIIRHMKMTGWLSAHVLTYVWHASELKIWKTMPQDVCAAI